MSMSHLRPLPTPDEQPDGAPWDGVTKPRGVGGHGRFLTDVIVDLGLVPRERVDEAVDAARLAQTTPEAVLVDRGDLTSDALSRAIAQRHRLDHLDLSVFKVDMAAANLVSTSAARRYDALPVSFADERTLLVAMADPANVRAIDDLGVATGYEIRPAVAGGEDIAALISRLTHLDEAVIDTAGTDEGPVEAEVVDLKESADDAPVIKLVNQIVAQAVDRGASDIHLEPDGTKLRVRLRVDGVLIETANVPRRMVAGVVSRVKIMSELDIAERRLPQDGRIGLTIDGKHIDLRVVTLPSVHGESVVMRILDKSN